MDPWVMKFDTPTREILQHLADALLPLGEWIEQKEYEPPDADQLPWRQAGESLSTADLRAIDFIQALLQESAADTQLLDRWDGLRLDPLRHSPHDRPEEWRRARGLSSGATFGVVPGDNAPVGPDGQQVSRPRLYAAHLPLLAAAVAARKPADGAAWKAFALELHTDQCPQWPVAQPLRSSNFVFQFMRDLLYALLGMRNPVPEPWRSAVLTEIGERRRPGNAFTREDVERGLEEFKAALATFFEPAEWEQVAVEAEAARLAAAEVMSPSLRSHYLEFRQRRL